MAPTPATLTPSHRSRRRRHPHGGGRPGCGRAGTRGAAQQSRRLQADQSGRGRRGESLGQEWAGGPPQGAAGSGELLCRRNNNRIEKPVRGLPQLPHPHASVPGFSPDGAARGSRSQARKGEGSADTVPPEWKASPGRGLSARLLAGAVRTAHRAQPPEDGGPSLRTPGCPERLPGPPWVPTRDGHTDLPSHPRWVDPEPKRGHSGSSRGPWRPSGATSEATTAQWHQAPPMHRGWGAGGLSLTPEAPPPGPGSCPSRCRQRAAHAAEPRGKKSRPGRNTLTGGVS